uniref:Uncharacterized protein n=1 Tax=Anopheles epiroticus TaxID=199890 RepID=A0A182PSH8_9DIPT
MKQQQLQQQYNRPRTAPDEWDSTNNSTPSAPPPPPPVMQQRTTMARCPELVRRTQGRGRPRQDHPIYALNHPGGDCGETDGDIDDTLSEFAGGWYTPRRRHTSLSSLRPSTLKKLNDWLDSYQQDTRGGELRLTGYSSGEEEAARSPRESFGTSKLKECKQQECDKELEETTTPRQVVPLPVQEVTSPKINSTDSSGVGHRLLSNLMMMLMHLAEMISPITLQLLTVLRDRTKTAIVYLWDRFVQPMVANGTPPQRKDPTAMVSK